MKGPVVHRDEQTKSSSNRARDIGFELLLGAQLLIAGLDVEFHPDGDLRFDFCGHEFFVECKRPQADHQIHSRVRDAEKQLARRYASARAPHNARGLIALSLTKLANPLGDAFKFSSRNALSDFHTALAVSFATKHGKRWQRPSDDRTLGALLELKTFSFGTSDDSLSTGCNITLNSRDRLDSQDEELLAHLSDTILSGLRP